MGTEADRPTYAVPLEDVAAQVVTAAPTETARPDGVPATGASHLGARMVYDPSVPFSAHTTDGEVMTVHAPLRSVASVRPADPDLAGYVSSTSPFDACEEDERNVAHPRPVPPRRHPAQLPHVRSSSGHALAESSHRTCCSSRRSGPLLLAADDVRTDLLAPSDHLTYCAYKGGVVLVGGRQAPRVALPAPAPRRVGDRRPDRVLQRAGRPVVDGMRPTDVVTTCLTGCLPPEARPSS